jgi:hypothetical protein
MFDSLIFKSLELSALTGSITEAIKVILLYMNFTTENTMLIALIFSYILAYIVQRYVFCGGRFFGRSLLKYCAVVIISVQITKFLLQLLQNNKFIKKYTEDETISNTRRKIYNYLLINISVLTIFFAIDYPLRKSFVFMKKDNDYVYSYILYCIGIVIYICRDYY